LLQFLSVTILFPSAIQEYKHTANIITNVLVLYGCEFWSQALRGEHNLIAFDNNTQRRIFGPKRRKYQEAGNYYIMRTFMIFYSSPSIVKAMKSGSVRQVSHASLLKKKINICRSLG
jgi:hypothetical protein